MLVLFNKITELNAKQCTLHGTIVSGNTVTAVQTLCTNVQLNKALLAKRSTNKHAVEMAKRLLGQTILQPLTECGGWGVGTTVHILTTNPANEVQVEPGVILAVQAAAKTVTINVPGWCKCTLPWVVVNLKR